MPLFGRKPTVLPPGWERRRKATRALLRDSLARAVPEGANPLAAARNVYLDNAIEALVFDLHDLAPPFLKLAKDLVAEAFRLGIKPFIGCVVTGTTKYSDNEALSRHHAIAHKTAYLAGLLLGEDKRDELSAGLDHLRYLVESTNGLSGPIDVAKTDILRLYLWFGILAGDPAGALQATDPHLRRRPGPNTIIRSFAGEEAYVRMLWLVAQSVAGNAAFRLAGRKSLGGVLSLHADIEGDMRRLALPGEGYGFEWAWVWEHAFEPTPSVAHAIEIIRGNVSLD